MPTDFVRPTPLEIFTRVKGDIEGKLAGVSAQLARTFEFAVSCAITGVSDVLHAHLAWVAEQILPDQAVERFVLRFASAFGVERVAASKSVGPLTVAGTGGTLPADTLWVRLTDGFTYKTDATVASITSSTAQLTAVTAGASGDLAAGQKLYLVSPLAGVLSEAVVASGGLAGGANLESLESLLGRLLDHLRKPAMGGAPGDHEKWAREVSGVTRAWEYKGTDGIGNPGLGKVALTFLLDDEVDVIPDSGKVAEVQAYLDARSPAQVIVFAPTPVPFDYEVIIDPPLDVDVQDAVEVEVQDMLRRDAVPGGTIRLSRFDEAVSVAAGEDSHETVSPAADVPHGFGQIAVYGTPTFS